MSAAPGFDPLPPRVRAEFSVLRCAGDLPGGAGSEAVGEAGSREQGTWVRFALRVAAGQVAAARFRAYGCPYTLAACNWLAGRLEGRPPTDAALGAPEDWAVALGIPLERLGRLLVIEDALRAALAEGRNRAISMN